MKIKNWQILWASTLLLFGCKSHQEGTNRDSSVGSAAKVQQLFRKSIDYSQISSVYKGPAALLADQTSDKRQAESSVVSANGYYIAFVSRAQLTADAPSQGLKIYRRFVSGEGFGSVELVSKRPATTISSSKCSVSVGAEAANGDSYSPSISADGNKIAFISEASNLAMEVNCDGTSPKAVTATGLSPQVYLIDMTSNKLTLVSGKNLVDGNRIADEWPVTDRPAISGDGKIIAFVSRDASLVTKGIAKKDGLNKGILVYNSNNGQTMWVNFLGLSASPSMPDDDSDSPILSYDGRYLLFKSAARLIANDKSDVGVADIYRAEFTMGADGPNERSDLQLVSVDKSGFSVGDRGVGHADMSSDGRYVVFQTQRSSNDLVTGWQPEAGVVVDKNPVFRVFLRDMNSKNTSLISVGQHKNAAGIINFHYFDSAVDHAYNPTISPDAQYVMFTSTADDVYLNDKMIDYKDAKIVPGTENSAKNLLLASYENTSLLFGQSKPVKGGWRDLYRMQAVPALDPNVYDSSQVYRVKIDLTRSMPIPKEIIPLSITKPMIVTHFLTDGVNAEKKEDSEGNIKLISEFSNAYQVLYSDKDSESGYQNMSNDSKITIFYSAADNLIGPITYDSWINKSLDDHGAWLYDGIPNANVGWYYKNDGVSPDGSTKIPKNPYDPIGLYYLNAKSDVWQTYYYLPVNQITGIEK